MNQLEAVSVQGGHVAVARALRETHGWDGNSIITAVQHRLGTAGNVECSSWLAFGSLKPFTVKASDIWETADKGLRVVFEVKDLTTFTFGPLNNFSNWARMGEVNPKFYTGDRANRRTLTAIEALTEGAGDLACRIHIIPISTVEGKLWFSVIPMCLQDLEEVLPEIHTSNVIPTITFAVERSQRDEGRGKAAKTTLGVREVGDSIGIGAMAFIDSVQVEQGAPALSPEVYKEATIQVYRAVKNNIATSARDFDKKLSDVKRGRPSTPAPVKMVFEDYRAPTNSAGW